MLMVKVPRGHYTGIYLCESVEKDVQKNALLLKDARTGNNAQRLGTLVIHNPCNVTVHDVPRNREGA